MTGHEGAPPLPPPGPRRGRPLGPLEREIWKRVPQVPLQTVAMGRVEGALSPESLRIALDWLAYRHPALRVGVQAGDAPQFLSDKIATVPVRTVQRCMESQWQRELERELNSLLPVGKSPLARVVWLEGEGRHELLLTLHHLLADSLSVAGCLSELVDNLAHLAQGEVPALEPLPLRPPIEDLLPRRARGRRRLEAVSDLLRRQAGLSLSARTRGLGLDALPPPSFRACRVLHTELDGNVSAAILASCREHHASVQGALAAATLIAAAEDMGLENTARLACLHAIDLRPQLTLQVGRELGMYISGVVSQHTMSRHAPFWSLAREARSEVVRWMQRLPGSATFPFMGPLAGEVGSGSKGHLEKQDLLIPSTVAVSNLGALRRPAEGARLRLTSLHASLGTVASVPFALMASSFDGKLTLNCVYLEPLISGARARKMADSVRGHLEQAARE